MRSQTSGLRFVNFLYKVQIFGLCRKCFFALKLCRVVYERHIICLCRVLHFQCKSMLLTVESFAIIGLLYLHLGMYLVCFLVLDG